MKGTTARRTTGQDCGADIMPGDNKRKAALEGQLPYYSNTLIV
jgi:hypothetical protein